ncbi:MAG: radical SAM protein [Clostridiaceae bacterium]|nr:radical SAM protein [Clostridiaceae bacterium]
MQKVRNITGFKKILFNQRVKLGVFFRFLPKLLTGRIGFLKFIIFLKRLLYFLSKMQHNKFVKIGANTRVDLYCPGYPSRAFYTAASKFSVFSGKLPCTTVLVSVTSACSCNCSHCYQKHDKGKDIDIDVLISVVRKLQDMGIAFFNIEGGEPFLVYDRLIKLCREIDNRSEIWINSTGYGLTLNRLLELKKNNVTAIMFSLHTPEPMAFNSFLGKEDAWDTMSGAVELCHKAGIAVAFNSCLGRQDFYNGNFEKVMERAREFNASIIQLIKPKPSGGWLETGVEPFNHEDLEHLKQLVNKYNLDKDYSSYPSISAQAIEEDKTMFGCTAGGTDRFYINAKGDVQPCEFVNISFGNIGAEPFDEIYQRMRSCFEVPGECWLCEKYSKEILKLYRDNNLKALPLPPELSKQIYENWDRGNKTELYQKLSDPHI